MKNFVLKNMKELEDMLYVRNLDLSRVVVDTIIENIDKKRGQIHIANIEVQKDDLILELTVQAKEFISTLEKNLETFESHEEYETCAKIIKNIDYLKQKK
jgi:hypothetical protein